MRKYFISLILCLSSLIFANPIQDHKIDPKVLSELALALGISPDKNLIEETQKHWLRKSGQERWELKEINLDQRHFVLNWAKKNGFFCRLETCL